MQIMYICKPFHRLCAQVQTAVLRLRGEQSLLEDPSFSTLLLNLEDLHAPEGQTWNKMAKLEMSRSFHYFRC